MKLEYKLQYCPLVFVCSEEINFSPFKSLVIYSYLQEKVVNVDVLLTSDQEIIDIPKPSHFTKYSCAVLLFWC